jgi:predicted dehydrogenase
LLDVVGTQGAALSEIPGDGLTFWTDKSVEVPDTSYWPSVHGATAGALRAEFEYFIKCITKNEKITIPRPEEAYQSIRIAHALLESAQCGKPIRLQPDMQQ